jgi:hypothetical protein
MSDAIPAQHPAVVLRSHYVHLRMLLAITMIALVGLTVAVVILATNDTGGNTAPVASQPASIGYQGGPSQGTPGAVSSAFRSYSAPSSASQEAGPTPGSADAVSSAFRNWPSVSQEAGPTPGTADAVSSAFAGR